MVILTTPSFKTPVYPIVHLKVSVPLFLPVMDQLKLTLSNKRIMLMMGMLICALVAVELQAQLMLELMQQFILSTKMVLIVEAVVFMGVGILTHWAYRRYLSQRSFVKDALSERELEVFYALLSGKSNQDIRAFLFIEKSTLKTHINRIYKKLNVHNREELIRTYSA